MSLRGLRGMLMGVALAAAATAAPGAAQTGGDSVAVAARDLARGEILSPADVTFAPGAGTAPAAREAGPVGWVTRRVVRAGEVLREPAIAPPDAVRAGEAVQLVWRQGSLELRLRGNALGRAAVGERVGVRVDVRRRFQGVVEAPGVVRLESRETT